MNGFNPWSSGVQKHYSVNCALSNCPNSCQGLAVELGRMVASRTKGLQFESRNLPVALIGKCKRGLKKNRNLRSAKSKLIDT